METCLIIIGCVQSGHSLYKIELVPLPNFAPMVVSEVGVPLCGIHKKMGLKICSIGEALKLKFIDKVIKIFNI